MQDNAHLMPALTSLEAETVCKLLWNSDLEAGCIAIHEAGYLMAEMLDSKISAAPWDLSDPKQKALLDSMRTLEAKLRNAPHESTYMLFTAVLLMEFAPKDAIISEFLVIENG